MRAIMSKLCLTLLGIVVFLGAQAGVAAGPARDPGVRGGSPGAGAPLAGLSADEQEYFAAGLDEFSEAEGVGDGLGPRFNLDGCGGCHMQPAIGGSSPPVNPQVAVATAFGSSNTVPSFITISNETVGAVCTRSMSLSRSSCS